MQIEEIVEKYTLQNAIEHNGTAFSKSVIGKILSDHPEMRPRVMELKHRVEDSVKDANSLTLKQQKKKYEKYGELTKKKKKKEEAKELSELPGAKIGKFVVRMAPNPNGPLHLGNSRPAILNHEYKKKYKGEFILRFDDTDPKTKVPEKRFYEWVKEDLEWLGIEWDKTIIASKRLDIYYDYAEQIIEKGKAYVCDCDREEFKKLKDAKKPCKCRNLSVAKQKKRWKKMFNKTGYKEGEAVLRVKTDIENPNPALRDWPAFRIIEKSKHPLEKKTRVWPLLDFQSAIDDHLLGVTHILRGIDLQTSEKRQKYLYQYFGWEYPVAITVGKFSISDMVLSKSRMKKGIESNEFRSWDDTKLGTLRALKRRGIQPEAIRNMVMDIGSKPVDVTISMKNLASYNRKIIDEKANRYFFVPHPMKITVKNNTRKTVSLPLHPTKDKGVRKLSVGKTLYVDARDYEEYRNMEIRLKDLFNIILKPDTEITSQGVKNIPKIQWVPVSKVNVRILKEDKIVKGYAEKTLEKEKIGNIVQFERYGFVKIENKADSGIVAIFTHE